MQLFGFRISVGIDARRGAVLTHGWEREGELTAVELARRVADVGVDRIVYTDVARDGMLGGVNLEQTCAIARESGLRVTASGGVSSLADLARVEEHPAVRRGQRHRRQGALRRALHFEGRARSRLSSRGDSMNEVERSSDRGEAGESREAANVFAEGVLRGRVAFVTGGGTGITGGVARALAEAGARVALVSRKMEHLEPAAARIREAGGEAVALAADVRDYAQVEQAVAAAVGHFGHVDIVVNGAAGNFLCRAEELSPNGFGTVVDIDLKGTFNVCRAAFERVEKERAATFSTSAPRSTTAARRCSSTSPPRRRAWTP